MQQHGQWPGSRGWRHWPKKPPVGRQPVRADFPLLSGGARIGLFGGSFDPPHSGHVHVTRWALKSMRLDQVWWLVAAGNPLKSRRPAAPSERLQAARRMIRHPRVRIVDLEVQAGLVHTVDTLTFLQSRFPSANFVWLMGSDNLAQFHRWERWREVFARVPIGVFARRTDRFAAVSAVAARTYSGCRLVDAAAGRLAGIAPPAWAMIRLPLDDASSTRMRATAG